MNNLTTSTKYISLLCMIFFILIFANCRGPKGEIESYWDLFDYDGDGITDGRDLDDDNDDMPDKDEAGNPLDQCRRGNLNWTSYTQAQVDTTDGITETTDAKGDVCDDTDQDGFSDSVDDFPTDACGNMDTYKDGIPNSLTSDHANCDANSPLFSSIDNCPLVPNADQANNYASDDEETLDAQGDACDDTDGDELVDLLEIEDCVREMDCDNDTFNDNIDVDDDGDGLIDISTIPSPTKETPQ